jgi:addiction module HigA family antidote
MLLPKDRAPTHPGEILREEFLEPLGMTQSELAERIGVSFPRVNEIVNGKRGITSSTALRLSQLFGTTPDFWLNLQHACELWETMHSKEAKAIEKIKPIAVGSRT